MAEKVNAIRVLPRSGGRTLAQGGAGVDLGTNPADLANSRDQDCAQVSEKALALDCGPVPQDVVTKIRQLPSRLASDCN